MTNGKFKVGDLVRSDFFWPSTKNQDGDKDRHCMVARATDTHVILVPITHRPPDRGRRAVELTPRDKQGTGLDDERNWIMADTANIIPVRDAGAFLRPTGRKLPAHVANAVTKQLNEAIETRSAWAKKVEIDPVQREMMDRAAGKQGDDSTRTDTTSTDSPRTDRTALHQRIRDRAAVACQKRASLPSIGSAEPRRPTLTIRSRASVGDERS